MQTESRTRISDADAFGRVAVVYGGLSPEREISLLTGKPVLAALQEKGVDAHGIDAGVDLLEVLANGRFDRAWIALHGRGGEDGSLQGALQLMGLPYTGSGIQGSALGMDKYRSKLLMIGCGLPTPPFRVLAGVADLAGLADELGLPLAIKPACEGSSLGMAKVTDAADLEAAYELACRHDDCVIAELWLDGGEYTTGILQGEALPIIRIETPRSYYDYQAKYFSDSTRYHCPAGLSAEQELRFRKMSLQVFADIGGEGWGRVDFVLD
ncbi:MAG: D-alanine--D-alanine ligase, partial [Proteobacteria bacterium]|nr:D-alanine--D-alanine ligase [Pseudomonadota bacterium]